MSNTRERDDRPGRGRPPRLIAFAFLGAFAASIATIIYTGLLVNGPRQETAADGGAGEAGIPAQQNAGTDARAQRADGNGGPIDDRRADGDANEDPEGTNGERADSAEAGGAQGEITQ